jgi:type IV pilus assembly protein PilQ
MMLKIKLNVLKSILLLLFIQFAITVYAQDKYNILSDSLQEIAKTIPALNEEVNISVAKVSIQEFLRGVANNSGLNIDVDPSLNISVVNNFVEVKVRDLLVFVCRQYNLELKVTGNIFSIYKSSQVEPIKRQVSVDYDSLTNHISIETNNEILSYVVKDITTQTNKNIVLSPGLNDIKVTGYIQDMPFDNALEKFMYENNLLVSKTEDNFYVVSQKPTIDQSKEIGNNKKKGGHNGVKSGDNNFEVTLLSKDTVKVFADAASVSDIIYEVAQKTNANYYISGNIDATASINLKKGTFKDVLSYLLNGTKFSFRKIDSLYFISDDKGGLIQVNKLIRLKKRSINKLLEAIPKSIKEGLDIVEFPELNGFLVSGATTSVDQFSSFIDQIDQPVPVILIEAIIADISDNVSLSTGITAGTSSTQTPGFSFNGNGSSSTTSTSSSSTTTSNSSPGGISITVGSQAINTFLQANHLGALGNLMPNVYLSLNALESKGLANIRSTPQLSTLNGHEATLSIGETTYYLEQQSSLIGTQNPVSSSYQSYKPLKAELTLSIKPFIANDNQITLEIELSQSSFNFANKVTATGPPGTLSKTFKAQIRVQNQEMFLLGGLEEENVSDNTSGVPLLSRIPILKWIFGTRSKTNNKERLTIFIRPTIVN